MQDFTKLNNQDLQTPLVATNKYGGIDDTPTQPGKGFIEARLSKDNFWNLMFAIGMTFGFVTAFEFGREYSTTAFLVSWSTILGIPLLVRKYTTVSFTTAKTFLNSQGEDISSRIPKTLVWLIVFTIGVTALTGNIIDNHGKNLPEIVSSLLIFFALFFSFSSYFILINCPISVLFNLDVWKQKSDFSTPYQPRHKSAFDSSHDDRYSLSRSYLPCNIHHRSR